MKKKKWIGIGIVLVLVFDIGVVSFLLIPTAFGDTPGSIR